MLVIGLVRGLIAMPHTILNLGSLASISICDFLLLRPVVFARRRHLGYLRGLLIDAGGLD